MSDLKSIEYDDVNELRAILVGHRIVETRKGVTEDDWEALDSIEFVLDNGVILEAREANGGCACSNGCWSVETPGAPTSVITDVEVVDEKEDEWGESATLRMFVYSEGIKSELVTSEGGDNGYYGWGYHVYVKEPADER